jgi:hypothetical protein
MMPVSMYVHWRSRERIHVRAARANVRARLHIQRWRPNGCIDRDQNWYKHSLWQSAQHTRVGDDECAFMRARENVRPALHIRRWRLNGWTDRDRNWFNHSLGQSAQVMGVGVCIARDARAAHNYGGAVVPRKREVGELARSARVHEWNMGAQPPRTRCASVRRAQCAAHRTAWSRKIEKSCGISEST